MFGDLRQEETGRQPRWSMRRNVIGKLVPPSWFGPDHK